MSFSIHSSRTSISSMNRRGSFQTSPGAIQLASQNKIHKHIHEALAQLRSLKDSGLIAKFKSLKKNLANNSALESDDAPEEYSLPEEEIDINDYITGLEYSLLFLNSSLSEDITVRQNQSSQIKYHNITFDDENIEFIEQAKEKIKELLDEIKQLLANPYKHPSFLEKRWITWLVSFAAALINSVLAYLCGAHLINLPPEIFSMINAVLTILPRSIQERFNLHDLNGAYKEKEWKENAAQLDSLQKSLESIYDNFHAIHDEIDNFLLREGMLNAIYSTFAVNKQKNLIGI